MFKKLSTRSKNRSRDDTPIAILLGGPTVMLMIVFILLPLIGGFQLSRTNKGFNAQEPDSVGWNNYNQLLSITIVKLPPLPDELPERTSSGWYSEDGGETLSFRWRNLDEIGLEDYEDYRIWERFSLFVNDTQYAILAKDPLFWTALQNTLQFVLIVVPLNTCLALGLALLVNQKLRGIRIFRTIYFMPVVTPVAVISVVWFFLYNPEVGLINEMIETLSFGKIGPYEWLQDPKLAMPAIAVMSVWRVVGINMLIFLAGLQDIPDELYEASSIDGASSVQQFRFITLPLLRNTTIFVVLTLSVASFRLFDQVQIMTPDGGPDRSTATLVWYAIRKAWNESQVGYASTITIAFTVVILIIAVAQRLIVRSDSALEM